MRSSNPISHRLRAPNSSRPTRTCVRIGLEQLETRETPALFSVQGSVALGNTKNFGCVATGDFNGDGKTDFVLTNYGTAAPGASPPNNAGGNTISILLGNGNGTFAAPSNITVGTDQYVAFVAVGDLNGDSKQDLAVVSNNEDATGRLTIYMGNGSGGFSPSAQSPISTASSNVCWVGIAQMTNGDTNLDVVVCSFGNSDSGQTTVFGNNIGVFQGDGTGAVNNIGTVTNGLAFIPTALALADFDGDGKMDIAATVPGVPPDSTSPQPTGTIQMFTGNGNGGFAVGNSFSSGGALPIAMTVANLNSDTLPDLVIANAGDPDGSNFYQNFGLNSAIGVAINAGGGSFNTNTFTNGLGVSGSKSVFAVTVADFDLDGKPDMAAVVYGNPLSGANARILAFKGDGNGGFTADANSPYNTLTTGGQFLAAAPIDTNTSPDIVYCTDAGRYGVLLNNTVAAAPTTTTLTAPTTGTSVVFGAQVTFTATVAPGTVPDGGTVQFKSGSTVLGSGTLTAGTATFSTTTLAVGTYNVTATYQGVSGFAASTSSPASTLTITSAPPAATTTTAFASPTTITVGQTSALSATVTTGGGGTPTGIVNFLEGTTVVGSGNLNGGTAMFTTYSPAVGTHTLFARHVGNASFASSDSGTFTVTVNPAGPSATTTTLVSSAPTGSVFTQSVTFTAHVASGGGTPGGTVNFLDNGSQIGTGTINGAGDATFSPPTLSVANHPITAIYTGNASFTGSTSNGVNQLVAPANTTISLVGGVPNPSNPGQSVPFSATVVPVSPASGAVTSGSVNFFDGGTPIGSANVTAGGVATLPITTLTSGSHTITAQYSATSSYNASPVSNSVTQTVTTPAAGTTTTVASDHTSGAFTGQPVMFTATVTPTSGTPTGTVTFLDGSITLGTIGLTGTTAAITAPNLSVGSHTITAQYNPGGGFLASSGTVPQSVQKITTTVGLSANAITATPGATVTFTAQVNPGVATAFTPTGTVTFQVNGTTLGTVAAGSGSITFPTSALPTGTDTITAIYGGDTSFAGNTSAGVTVTVAVPPPPPPPTGQPITIGGTSNGVAVTLQPDGTGQYDRQNVKALNPFGNIPAIIRTATADVNGDGVPDSILVTGSGVAASYAIVNGKDNSLLVSPTDPIGVDPTFGAFTTGLFVTAGDINGDGRAEWIISPEDLGGPRTIIFSLVNGSPKLVSNYFGIGDSAFRGGQRTTLGDVDGDGKLDVICIAAAKGGPRLSIFNGSSVFSVGLSGDPSKLLANDIFVADPASRSGLYIAAGDVNGDGFADIVVTNDPKVANGAEVRVLSGLDLKSQNSNPTLLADFTAAGMNPAGGLRVATTNLDGDKKADLLVGSGAGQVSNLKVYLGQNVTPSGEPMNFSFDPFNSAVLADGIYVG